MPSTAVVADSTSYLPPEILAQHDIKVVSLYVGLEGEQERESDISDLHAFYERLRISDQTVTTSQPSVGDFISVYEPLLTDGREIVSVHLSSGISGTYESAMQARERLTADGKGGGRTPPRRWQGRRADRGGRLAHRLWRAGADAVDRGERRGGGRQRRPGEG